MMRRESLLNAVRRQGIGAKLDEINKTLERHNDIAIARLEAMPKPESRLTRVLKVFVLVAGALAIFNSADIVRSWITGG